MHRAHVIEARYDDDYSNSHKFYRAYALSNEEENDYRVLFNWGRVGTNGQFQVQVATSGYDAKCRAESKIEDKERKGYAITRNDSLEVVPNDLLERAGVNVRSEATARTVSEFDTFTSEVDTAIRYATGDTSSQVKAVVMARDLESKLTALRVKVMEAESRMETVQMLLSVRLG